MSLNRAISTFTIVCHWLTVLAVATTGYANENTVRLSAKQPNFVFFLAEAQGWASTSVQLDPKVAESKSTSFTTPICVFQISSASCSTQPGCGKCCSNSRCATPQTLPP